MVKISLLYRQFKKEHWIQKHAAVEVIQQQSHLGQNCISPWVKFVEDLGLTFRTTQIFLSSNILYLYLFCKNYEAHQSDLLAFTNGNF